MGQYWTITNIDKREMLSLSKLASHLFSGFGLDALAIMLFHPPNTEVFLPTASLKKALTVRKSTACHLLRLPTELLHAIFELLVDIVDAICLGLTCQTLWNIGRRRMEKEMQELATLLSWAGDRLICVGDYLEDGDMPPGLLTADEEAEFLDPLTDAFWHRDDEVAVASTKVPSLHRLNAIGRMMWTPHRASRCITLGDFEVAEQLFDQCAWNIQHLTRNKQLRVLRNLSRRQVVFEADLFELRKQPNMGECWFTNLVLMKICWSSDYTANIRGQEYLKIHRGDWAGDRFDIVTEPDFIRECAGPGEEEWTNVGNELLKEAEELWALQN
ncbi:hypothetical protein B0H15DRAFT_833021 [Mycena belliarum]|uniref:F-box domain-containing protein n=1 Tax=Mycena belliarum TaxID=1033014 RepID=A0AAD6UCE7_9AGAR|nr:hypothetical protein B0H15DRAFT_833021 [Mycena belliae]